MKWIATLTSFVVLSYAATAAPAVGIVMHDASVSDNATGEYISKTLPKKGITLKQLTYDALENLDRAGVKTLIIPQGRNYPVTAADALHRYLSSGGSVIAMGGDPFARPLMQFGGKWLDFPALNAALYDDGKAEVLADPLKIKPGAWKQYRKNNSSASQVKAVKVDDKEAFLFEFRDNIDFDEFTAAVKAPSSATANALIFRAKADGLTPQFMLRLKFADGTKLESPVEVRPGWNVICVPLDVMDKKSGQGSKLSTLKGVTEITFAMSVLRHRFHDHDLWVSAVKGVTLPAGYRNELERGSFILCEERDLYRYAGGTSVSSFPLAPIAGFTASGSYAGISALGFPVFGESEYVPLLETTDSYGRRLGWAAGMVVNNSGKYAGSRWAVFGVEDEAFYRTDAFAGYLAQLITLAGKAKITVKFPDPPSAPKPEMARLIIKGNQIVRENDGKPIFFVGENLGGILYDRPVGKYDRQSLDMLFRQLNAAGVNGLRLLNISNFVTNNDIASLYDAAERWGVYLLAGALPPAKNDPSKAAIETYIAKLAKGFKGKPALLGYDLANEPYPHEIGALKGDNGVALKDKYTWPKSGFDKLTDRMLTPQGHGTNDFQGMTSVLPRPKEADAAEAYDAINNIYGEWIDWCRAAFKREGDDHPITVGFNMWYAALPVGAKLDFITQHSYIFPTNLAAVMDEVTVMDRLHAIYPDKPFTMGEFGYSQGYIVNGEMLTGQAQALGETLHLLYAWAQGYNGVFDWQVYDFDPVNYPRIASWRDRSLFKQNYERFHGIYTYDGTPEGLLKPFGMAMRFVSRAVTDGLQRGKVDMYKADTQLGTGFTFKAPNALFVGDKTYRGEMLSFNAPAERVLGVYWNGGKMSLMATGDMTVTFNTAKMPIRSWSTVTGKTAKVKEGVDTLEIALLAGETVTLE